MVDGTPTTLQNLKITSKTSLDDILSAVQRSAETPAKPIDPASPASANPAVAHCCQAYTRALNAARSEGKGTFASSNEAERAYRGAMPPLMGSGNIRDFIACIAHGMLIDAITGPDGARLLYAAQVAHASLDRPEPRGPGRPPSPS
jgi:hypothetical protein